MKLFDIPVNYVVEGETEAHAVNTLVKLANLDHATEADHIYECRIDEPQELEEHEAKDYRA